eukprot:1124623-Rhodomonas_salina.2
MLEGEDGEHCIQHIHFTSWIFIEELKQGFTSDFTLQLRREKQLHLVGKPPAIFECVENTFNVALLLVKLLLTSPFLAVL